VIKQLDIFGNIAIPEDEVPAIPYMGNKRKFATKFINAMFRTVGEFDKLYDLFGGGASVSVAGLISGLDVHYNDLNAGVVNLLKYLKSGGEIPYEWVSREEFNRHKNGNDWYSGLVKSCWSFGNNQKSYLFGNENEILKKECHEYLMQNGYDKTAETRIRLIDQLKKAKIIEGRLELEQLQQLQQLEQLEQLQQLQQLEQLEQLQQLQQLERLEITNLSYDEVKINPVNSVVYCDIPYKNTANYQEGKNFDYEKFYGWCCEHESEEMAHRFIKEGFVDGQMIYEK
jgi:hypothetical protein